MRRRLFRVAVAAAIVCGVLAPALIWSGQKPRPAESAAGEDLNVSKLPPFFTAGPPLSPEEQAARDAEKSLSILQGQRWARDPAAGLDRPWAPPAGAAPPVATPPPTSHPGLSPEELQKLAAIRSGVFQPREDRGTRPPKPDLKPEKLDLPTRPTGPEGLTPEEKAKLEASRARETREGKTSKNEGGRSR